MLNKAFYILNNQENVKCEIEAEKEKLYEIILNNYKNNIII